MLHTQTIALHKSGIAAVSAMRCKCSIIRVVWALERLETTACQYKFQQISILGKCIEQTSTVEPRFTDTPEMQPSTVMRALLSPKYTCMY